MAARLISTLMKILSSFLVSLLSLAFALNSIAQETAVSPFDTTQYGRNAKVGHYLNTRGVKLYYEIYGKGAPLLMIHGNGGAINNFLYQASYFSKSYRVILVDSRAQGKSVDEADSLSYEMMADDFNALLDSLRLDSCYILGWSDGGINGLLLAMRHPDKVKKLAITGANLWPDTTAIGLADYQWAMNYYDSLKEKPGTAQVRHDLKLAYLISFEPRISLAQLKNILCPTLVIGGDHDIILPKHTMLIAQSIPGASLWIVPDSGHATLHQHKEQFNQVVDGFFQKPILKK